MIPTEIDLLLLREGTSRNGWQPTADALLTMERLRQPVATGGNGFRLFLRFQPSVDLPPALKNGADEEGGGEEHEREPDPGLAEVPSVAVEDEPDTQAKHGDHRGCEEDRPDHAQVADESGDGIALAAAENLGREDADREEAADPDHRGEDVQDHQPPHAPPLHPHGIMRL